MNVILEMARRQGDPMLIENEKLMIRGLGRLYSKQYGGCDGHCSCDRRKQSFGPMPVKKRI